MSTHRGTQIPEAIEVLRLEQRADARRRPSHTSPIPIVKENPVHQSDRYYDAATAEEQDLTSCPEGDECEACSPGVLS